jgi:TPR repeat protein
MEISTNEWNSYIESMKNALAEKAYWQEELDACLDMAEDAKNGDEDALLDLAVYKMDHGIDFEESLSFVDEKAGQGDVYALTRLGFLYCTGVSNSFDDSKKSLIEIDDATNEEKSSSYFEKASELGGVRAMATLVVHIWVWRNKDSEDSESEDDSVQLTAEDFVKAEKLALKAIDIYENQKEKCDVPDSIIALLMGWLSDLYASKNPLSPIFSQEKAEYWKNRSDKLSQELKESSEESQQ